MGGVVFERLSFQHVHAFTDLLRTAASKFIADSGGWTMYVYRSIEDISTRISSATVLNMSKLAADGGEKIDYIFTGCLMCAGRMGGKQLTHAQAYDGICLAFGQFVFIRSTSAQVSEQCY